MPSTFFFKGFFPLFLLSRMPSSRLVIGLASSVLLSVYSVRSSPSTLCKIDLSIPTQALWPSVAFY
jgi:hypothetical protein